MEQEEIKVKDIEHIKDKVKIIFASILGALLVLVEVYLMINSPLNYIAIALFGVLILIDLYFLVTSLIEISYRRELIRREQYDGIYKAEKASYMIFRKYFDSLAKTLNSMDEKLDMPAEEIISAQKAVAKVTINRSKENTDALMNSNDKLIEKLFEFQDMLSENNEKLLEKTAEVNSQNSKENEARIGELTGKMREMELSIKNEIYQTVNKMILSGSVISPAPAAGVAVSGDVTIPESAAFESTEPESMVMPEDMPVDDMVMPEDMPVDDMVMPDAVPVDDMEMSGDAPVDDMAIPEEMSLAPEADMSADEILENTEELPTEPTDIMEEPVSDVAAELEEGDITSQIEALPIDEMPSMESEEIVTEEIPPMPDLSDPNKQMSPDDIAALIANMGADSAGEAAEADMTEAIAEEPVMEEPVIEEAVAEEPVAEEIPPMPDLSDPNKQMSPDDIAALIANMGADSAGEAAEPVAEEPVMEEPVVEEAVAEEPVAEEIPPMPDMSDPNKQMSPDDIAALIANMNAAPAEDTADSAAAEGAAEAAEEPVIEDIPAMPDMSDPNKMMTPDEIEALFANL